MQDLLQDMCEAVSALLVHHKQQQQNDSQTNYEPKSHTFYGNNSPLLPKGQFITIQWDYCDYERQFESVFIRVSREKIKKKNSNGKPPKMITKSHAFCRTI